MTSNKPPKAIPDAYEGPRPLTPFEIEELKRDMQESAVLMMEELDRLDRENQRNQTPATEGD